MNELEHLQEMAQYRMYLSSFAQKSVSSILKFYQQSSASGIAPAILSFFDNKKAQTLANFSTKDRATWALQPFSNQYGAWFDHAPLEILPPLPSAPPSCQLLDYLEEFDNWGICENQELNHPAIFEYFFHIEEYFGGNKEDRLHRQWLGLYLLSLDKNPWTRDFLYNKGLEVHPSADIRALVLSLAFFDLPWVPSERYLYECTHDTDEVVFIKSFRICGRTHDEKAMDNLRPIVKSPSAVLEGLTANKMYYPVGHAACNICPAQFAIIRTDNPHLAKSREAELMKRNRRPLSEVVEHVREDLLVAIRDFKQPAPPTEKPDLKNMIPIPEGEFIFGMAPEEVSQEAFDWTTCTPQKKMHLEEFYIDQYPVTNQEYDTWEQAFSKLSPSEKRVFEHPGQKEHKIHRRNTFDDDRFQPDHPVVGIDWFDAWAYARYHNKELPTEYQWEKAARGSSTWRYPWGNHFNPQALRYAGETYQYEPTNIVEWIILLNKGTKTFPETTTASIYAHPEGASPYGVQDMCGNCWEFTKTSFITGEDARLPFKNFSPIELMGTREGHVVIRGGAWSSPIPLIGSSYRGYDLLTDRHTEIGFRCVYNPR